MAKEVGDVETSINTEETHPPPTTEAEHENENAIFDAPEGGTRAWLAAGGAAAIFFSTLGFSNSFGTFEEYYITHQLRGESASKVSWIGSLGSFLPFFSGMVAGPMFDRYGEKIIRPATIVYVFAMMILSLSVSQYFHKKRAAALGLAVAGSSIGGVIIPIVLSKLLNGTSLSFGWSVRIVGFIILPFMVFACVTVRARLPPRDSQFWITSTYRNIKFLMLILGFLFMFVGMTAPLFYLPTYAVSQGMGKTLSGYLIAIINAASTFGRILIGVLADKYGRINMFAIGGVASGVAIFCMNSAKSNDSLIVYSVAFGFASGTIISGGSAAFSVCPQDPRDIGTYMGMGMAISGLGALIGPPINGAIEGKYGGFFEVSMFSGAMCLLGGLVVIAAKLATKQGLLGRT
ncbi:monocarboxylate permease, putative [Talaromyces stipitatus ATCC 10500]|uniref:Monocarboxylate permease, putative n=1 Tax=Talaromyces stipitatus (strain ATCC 10500 / CBS 375.48 / QM 6759 / NRRL 1006) TaxID=441959 RepID=B8M701_TALSN|nr:monocarboxylate permease, putative [Talaromyces stipitatus ATCC 10500]EED20221.1 monocarboxylate permease, putative [Talaromyces stipitatus ATCC 10500]